MSEIKVTQIKSSIGTKPKHRGTLRALGIGKIGKTNILPDRPEIRGMTSAVSHLIEVEELSKTQAKPAAGKEAKPAANKESKPETKPETESKE